MINANQNITIINLRTDKKTRREVFTPTTIKGVSLHSVHQTVASSQKGGLAKKENLSYLIRIPIDADVQEDRNYISQCEYKELPEEEIANYWTIQKGCYVTCSPVTSEKILLTKEELDILISAVDANEMIVIEEYADNTKRGTDATKHWRIGGA